MHIRLAHSPDPDDAFMFYGLSNGAVDPGPYEFEHILEDIQTLNERASAASTRSPRSAFTPTRTSPTATP
jgi:predicted solute-binding protein